MSEILKTSKMIKCGDDIKLGSRVNMINDRITVMPEDWNNNQAIVMNLSWGKYKV